MKKLVCLLLVLMPLARAQINEVMYNPCSEQGSDSYNEWFELYNPSEQALNVSGWSVCGDQLLAGYISHNDSKVYLEEGLLIPAEGFALVTDGGTGTEVYDNFNVSPSLALHVDASSICGGLNNDFQNITLDYNGSLLYSLNYSKTWGGNGNGMSLERQDGGWSESLVLGGTPGCENSFLTTTSTSTTTTTTLPDNTTNVSTTTTTTTTTASTNSQSTSSSSSSGGTSPKSYFKVLEHPEYIKQGEKYHVVYEFFSGSKYGRMRFVSYVYRGHKNICREPDGSHFKYKHSAYAVESELTKREKVLLNLTIDLKEGCDDLGEYTLRGRVYLYDDEWKKWKDKDVGVEVEAGKCEKEEETEGNPEQVNVLSSNTTEENHTVDIFESTPRTTGSFLSPVTLGVLIAGAVAVLIAIKKFPFS